jgi:acetyl esterase/lipase
MLVYAWAHHYRHRGPPLWSDKIARTVDHDLTSACAWSPAGGAALLADRLPRRALELFAPPFLAAYRSGLWGPYRVFRDAFATNRVRPYRHAAPLRIYQGTADTAVPERATRQLAYTLARGGVRVEYEVVPGAGHLDTAFGFLASREHRTAESIAWLRARLDGVDRV